MANYRAVHSGSGQSINVFGGGGSIVNSVVGDNNHFGGNVTFGHSGVTGRGTRATVSRIAPDAKTSVTVNGQEVPLPSMGGCNSTITVTDDGVFVNGKRMVDTENKIVNLVINITGSVQDSATVTSGQLTIGGDVGGDAQSSSGSIKIQGSVKGSIKVTSGNVTVAGNVSGGVSSTVGNVNIRGNATL